MKRLLLYVHFNRHDQFSHHVEYQLKKIRPLFSKVVFISNSSLSQEKIDYLKENQLIDEFLQRENIGFDFAAWRDGMALVGFDNICDYDSVTIMNDTCFGPVWDLGQVYQGFEERSDVDFWGMTNHRTNDQFREHIQSYFISFKQNVVRSSVFQDFWMNVEDHTIVQNVIIEYETKFTGMLLDAGFNYDAVFDTREADLRYIPEPHRDFSYFDPGAIVKNRVPFIKVKTIDANQLITPYILDDIRRLSDYPIELIINHMSNVGLPDYRYLLAHKHLKEVPEVFDETKKIAVHLHVFYTDLLEDFLDIFATFRFTYDLYLTTDSLEKEREIQTILEKGSVKAKVVINSNVGRDVLPMLKLKADLSQYDFVGHFHTKKSKLINELVGENWRKELMSMMASPANNIVANLTANDDLGIVIADIPTFFRYTRTVVAWKENMVADEMNRLWKEMGMQKDVNFNDFHTFVMSYGTFVWFRYDALEKLFSLNLQDKDIPKEPLPDNSILHAIERLLIYIAWDKNYDFRISKNPIELTPFIDSRTFNEKGDTTPNTVVDFDHMGGIRGAAKYIIVAPMRAIKYIIKRLKGKLDAS